MKTDLINCIYYKRTVSEVLVGSKDFYCHLSQMIQISQKLYSLKVISIQPNNTNDKQVERKAVLLERN